MQKLDGKVIIITGAAGLIGQWYSRSVIESGGIPIIADIDLDKAKQVSDELGGNSYPIQLDITAPNSVDALFSEIDHEFGGFYGLVNNAYPKNANYGRRVEEVTYSDFTENLSLHLGGYFLMMQKAALSLRAANAEGVIVNMSSIYGVVPPKFQIYEGTSMTTPVEYAAIKASVLHLTKYFARYYLKDRIRVNAISPGGIEDGQPESFLTKYKEHCGSIGMLHPSDLCQTLIFLISPGARHITGQNIVVDDGFTL